MTNSLNFVGQTKAQVITTLRAENKLTTDIETILAPLPDDQIIDGPLEAQILTSLGTTNEGDDSIRQAIQDRIVFTDKPVAPEKVEYKAEFYIIGGQRVFRGKRGETQEETNSVRLTLVDIDNKIIRISKTNKEMRQIFGGVEWNKILASLEETTKDGLTTATFEYLREKAVKVLGNSTEMRLPGTTWNLGESMAQNIKGPTTDAAKAKWNALSPDEKAKFGNDPKNVHVVRTSTDMYFGVDNPLSIVTDMKLSKFYAMERSGVLRHTIEQNIVFLSENEAIRNKAKEMDIKADAILALMSKLD